MFVKVGAGAVLMSACLQPGWEILICDKPCDGDEHGLGGVGADRLFGGGDMKAETEGEQDLSSYRGQGKKNDYWQKKSKSTFNRN